MLPCKACNPVPCKACCIINLRRLLPCCPAMATALLPCEASAWLSYKASTPVALSGLQPCWVLPCESCSPLVLQGLWLCCPAAK